MKITKLELKNFKRFDNLTIDMTGLAEPAKLVLLIGTNGSGKSSVFDAFEIGNRLVKNDLDVAEELALTKQGYYSKKNFHTKKFNNTYQIDWTYDNGKSLSSNPVVSESSETSANAFYGRTSIRQIPKLTRTVIGKENLSFEADTDRPRIFIDRDSRFENDIEKITLSILADVFEKNTTTEKIKESYINPINKAFDNIFKFTEGIGIKLISFRPPSEGKTAEILFEKGNSRIPYDFLSSGEKEIFNILLNLLTRKEYFQDTVYFLDEIDLHLNTLLQKNLLKEITENWIPDNCQLWTASHSLGFIEYANEAQHAAIIDFDNLNFDIPQVITPSPKNNADVFEIAVSKEFLSNILEGKTLIFSENTDTSLYNNLKIKDTIFLVAKDKKDVFHKSKSALNYNGLIDRDYLTDEERVALTETYDNLFILKYYSIENYLVHPDNMEEYYSSVGEEFDKSNYKEAIKAANKENRDKVLLGLGVARDSYPFYREIEYVKKLKTIRDNNPKILEMWDSDDFETYYKVFPAKDYGTQIKERKNIDKSDLAKTKWFKTKIEEVLTK